MFNQSCQVQTVDDVPGPVFDRGKFHKTVLAVFGIEVKVSHTRSDAPTAPKPMQIHCESPAIYMITKSHEHAEQPSCEDEEILSLQALVLHRPSDALID